MSIRGCTSTANYFTDVFSGGEWHTILTLPTADSATPRALRLEDIGAKKIRILASSEPGDLWHIYFASGETTDPEFSLDVSASGHLSGRILKYSRADEAFESVGAFALDTTITAVPEPEAYAMMLVGIVLIGWQLRRNSRRINSGRLH